MDTGIIVALLTALGAGTVLGKLVDGLLDWFKGRHGKEQGAWDQRDAEAAFRRRVQEALDETRRYAHIRAGIPYDDMPKVPKKED